MTKKSISEILAHTAKLETDEEQIEWLKQHDCVALRIILKFWYNPNIEFLLPSTPPPYTPLAHNNHGILYGKVKMLPLFVKGGTNPEMSNMRREAKFIQLLQQVHADDAKMLCKMISKKELPYLKYKVVKAAFPEIF